MLLGADRTLGTQFLLQLSPHVHTAPAALLRWVMYREQIQLPGELPKPSTQGSLTQDNKL